MLGELVVEMTGKRLVRRALSVDPPTVEVSFEDSGKTLGVGCSGFGSYSSVVGPDGSMYGQGQGAEITVDGDMITWKGSGVGKIKERGAVSYRGILYYRTASQKLARMNNLAGVFEYEVDPEGRTTLKVWEWK